MRKLDFELRTARVEGDLNVSAHSVAGVLHCCFELGRAEFAHPFGDFFRVRF